MTSLLSLSLQPPQSLFLSSPINRPSSNPFYSPKPFNLHHKSPPLRHTITLIKFSFRPPSSLPDFNAADGFIQDFFHKTEGLLYTLADAAVSVSASANGADKDTGDWFTGITNIMETVLKILKDGLSSLHVPYSYGFAIILLTVIVKAATFPLTKKQAESGMAMKSLQPQIKAIQQQYAGDQERIQLETARLYKVAGVNPLAGCLPTLATIPVWIGLYRALSNVANEGLLTEGFFWIPSLAGPTTVAARQNGSGISWIFPFVDGQPPLGWSDTLAYLVLPFLLIVSQYISVQIMQSSQSNDPNMKTSQALTKVLPLMIGYFALSVPSGLSLYWLTNNILSTTQQVWLQKLGGATNPVRKWDNSIKQVSQNLQELPIVDSTTKVMESIKEETPSGPRESIKEETPSGPRPGDRFKMLKEQEARKKKEREEAIKALNTEESIDDEKRIPVQKIENGSVDGKEEPVLNGKLKKEDETEMFTTNTTPVNGVEVEKREQEQVNKSNDK